MKPEDEQTRVTLYVPRGIKQKAQIKAIMENRTLSDVVREALRCYVEDKNESLNSE